MNNNSMDAKKNSTPHRNNVLDFKKAGDALKEMRKALKSLDRCLNEEKKAA